MRFLLPGYLISTRLRRWLLAFSAILLVALLVGLVSAYGTPDRLEQESSLLDYQHRGEFDYRVYLYPSYLFGSLPQQDLPPNQMFPIAIVDSIDFTFHYSPVAEVPADMWIDAVLQNPGIWQKEIELVPPTSVTGDFTASFSINVDEINELFDVIRDELVMPPISRNVDISAFVGTAEEHSVYTLALKLSTSLIEVDNNLRIDQASGTGEFDYVVNLKPNSVYDTETLTPPSTPATPSVTVTVLEPGDIIFLNLVDRMDVTYDYTFESNKPVNSVTTTAEIIVVLEASDIWVKEFPLLQIEADGSFNAMFSLDIAYYLDLIYKIASETGVSSESQNLMVSAKVHTTVDTPFGKIDDTFSHLIIGTYEVGILRWEEELAKAETGAITIPQVVSNPEKILGLSVLGARVTFSILTALSLFLGVYSVIFYFRTRSWEPSQVEQEALRIKKKYGDRVIEATSQVSVIVERTISLDSIESLVNAADELGKLIVHKPPVSPQEPHVYYVFDGITRYQYLLDTGYFVVDDTGSINVEFSP